MKQTTDKKSLIELLHDLIVDDLHLDTTKGVIHITEKQEQATCKCVDFKLKQSIPCFCFTIDKQREKDKGDPIFPFFNPEISGICSKNDAILICQKRQKIYIFLIELKSKNKNNYLKQLKSAQIFIRFILERIELYDLCKDNLKNLEFREILFSCKRTPNEGITKHQKVEFIDKKGLLVTYQECNKSYNLNAFLY
ncbi:hypothetical protein QUF50_07145 [Thiotrichales bacterium HSG1]|nr:hypothetical protein [Thiotrichales bacterium HSG1]